MRISLNWLRDYVDITLAPEDLAERLTMAGLEVSAVERLGEGIADVVVGEILEKGPHPGADRLSLCRVSDGTAVHDIVCGATNMERGDRVALARVGTRLPGGLKIKKAKIRGQESFGMMCSERELGLSDEHSGILILPDEAPLGESVLGVLGLPDVVFEVDLTPNRSDCLSVVGVAREVAALTGQELRLPRPVVPEAGDPIGEQTSIEILAPDLCHRYAARIVRGVTLGPSPAWMRQRLEASGVRAINNVVDVTNYVLLELGHPLHAFDLHRLAGERIVVQRAREGEVFTTLDGQERTLTAEDLVICDGECAVALAGVMGGLNSEVQEDTVDLLLESAYFLPRSIRRTSKRLGLSTEASYRFERGTDIEGLMRALDRTAELIVELAGGTAARGVWDAYPTRRVPRKVRIRMPKVESLLGVGVDSGEAAGYLEALGVPVLARGEGELEVELPSHRPDLEREVDLIEEIARLKGYDAIPTTLPRVPMACEPLPPGLRLAEAARDVLSRAGLREAISLSFEDSGEDDRLKVSEASELRRRVRLANPLSSETGSLRTSLLPGLLRAASLNGRRQARDVRLFEVGRTFHPKGVGVLPEEVLRAAGLISGRREPLAWWSGTATVDFFDAKGLVELLLRDLGIEGLRFEPVSEYPWLHPGRSARVVHGSERLGWVGVIHPECVEEYEIPSPAVAFEVDLYAAAGVASGAGHFGGLGRYPAVERDIALLVDRVVPVRSVVEAVQSLESPLVRSVVLFDAFEGGKLPENTVSLALRITYRSDERTLTEEEVSTVEKEILGVLTEKVGARLRDT